MKDQIEAIQKLLTNIMGRASMSNGHLDAVKLLFLRGTLDQATVTRIRDALKADFDEIRRLASLLP